MRLSNNGQKNYPFKKQNSDFDLPFDDNTEDRAYLNALKNNLPRLVDLFEPDFMFYLAGVDVLKTDKLGRLGLSTAGCKARDRFVLTLCKNQNIPVQVSMGGGYSIHLKNIIDAHSNTFEFQLKKYASVLENYTDEKSAPPVPEEVLNAFCVKLYFVEQAFESRSIDFLMQAFDLFPNRDYLILTQPHSYFENTLLSSFIKVEKKNDSLFNDMLYIVNRESLMTSLIKFNIS